MSQEMVNEIIAFLLQDLPEGLVACRIYLKVWSPHCLSSAWQKYGMRQKLLSILHY